MRYHGIFFFCCVTAFWGTENGMGADMRHKFYFLIQQITWVAFLLLTLFAVKSFGRALPDEIYVPFGEKADYRFGVPVSVTLKDDSEEVFYRMNGQSDTAAEAPFYTVTCKLFGIFPVKDVKVMMVDRQAVYAGGEAIGIYVKTSGVLVIGTSEVERPDGSEAAPAENILKAGDYILSVNGEKVAEKEDLQRLVQQNGAEKEILKINRKGEEVEVSVTPVQNKNGTYMLGAWVRDDLAGIGTLTYYKEDGTYGALGHAVSDGDVGERIQMREGYVYNAQIIGVKKGQKGNPGELSGMIRYQSADCLGTIEENTDIGIYGKLDGNIAALPRGDYYNICYKQDIKQGPATIICGFTGEKKEYAIEIESLDYSGREANKGILFRVTDEQLLDMTGGIVQGMSGSPILQDGKIIGAVTHVFVSDSSMGYGIFIENMVE